MLERLLSLWQGKLFVLALLGFVATDFLITITLSAADATAHIVENPYLTSALHDGQLVITLILVALLGAVFLKGFLEAIGVAVVLVGLYLALNAVVVVAGLWHVAGTAHVVTDWTHALTAEHGSSLVMIGVALLVFPKLALGLSGFETGVAVMPQVEGDPDDTEERPAGRIRGAKKLLTTAAVIMSVFLITTSFITTLLIPRGRLRAGRTGQRARPGLPGPRVPGRRLRHGLRRLHHRHPLVRRRLGHGRSAESRAALSAALRDGAALGAGGPPAGAGVHPGIAFLVTWLFDADVDAQGGAYATGVLVLITSAAIAVTIAARRAGEHGWTIGFGVIAVVFLYTTVANVVERPDGVKIGACFIAGIIARLAPLPPRPRLRTAGDQCRARREGRAIHRDTAHRKIRIIANEPGQRDVAEYRDKLQQIRADNDLPVDDDFIFVEVTVRDPSEFETRTARTRRGAARPLPRAHMDSSDVANALAALLLHVRDLTGARPHIYFEWTEGNPFAQFLRFFLFGQGEVAPVTREVLREAEPDRDRRPRVHVG